MKDEIINIIKEAMGENYKKVLWIFQEHIKNLINCYPSNENGLVFEYKSRISSNDVISIIMFEKTGQKINISLFFENTRKKEKILELNPEEKNSEELILKALFIKNKKVLLSDLFILDKVSMYYTRNKMFKEFQKLMIDNKEKIYVEFQANEKFIFKCPNCSRKNRKVFYAF
ncbi:hypothetical protein ML514_001656 [Campylobacter coli]|nr:hypothetical protein [Campylobacter coli]MBX0426230.1 hypothetical protein [Campylobacter coli]MCE7239229.1 hypothetical protein [Campylobacter coli]HED0453336.1 hypothetical protein [Campylobacter coli]HED0460565.1 hypothetical protein [Campylobacter coli]